MPVRTLTPEKVQEIKDLLEARAGTVNEVAQAAGVSDSSVWRIKGGHYGVVRRVEGKSPRVGISWKTRALEAEQEVRDLRKDQRKLMNELHVAKYKHEVPPTKIIGASHIPEAKPIAQKSNARKMTADEWQEYRNYLQS